jgi:hypothetical protein
MAFMSRQLLSHCERSQSFVPASDSRHLLAWLYVSCVPDFHMRACTVTFVFTSMEGCYDLFEKPHSIEYRMQHVLVLLRHWVQSLLSPGTY